MKQQTNIELRKKTKIGLIEELDSSLKTYFSLRVQNAMGQLTKNSEIKLIRRHIARLRTILHEMELSI